MVEGRGVTEPEIVAIVVKAMRERCPFSRTDGVIGGRRCSSSHKNEFEVLPGCGGNLNTMDFLPRAPDSVRVDGDQASGRGASCYGRER
jgi:hypothetical protein